VQDHADRALTVMQLLPALDGGGVERSTLEIAQALADAGHRSVVVSAGGRWLPRLLDTGSTHVELLVGRKSPWTLRLVFSLRRLIARHRPDVLHARSRLPAWLAWWALRGLPAAQRPAFVTTAHGLNSVGRYSAIMARGDRVIAVSDTVRQHLLANYTVDAGRIEVIERGIDPSTWPRGHRPDDGWRARLDREFPALAGRRLLLLPGRGTRLKGHGAAIALLGGLVQAGGNVALWMPGADSPGRGRYLDELRARASELGVLDRMVASPLRDDMRDAMAASELVLQLSDKPEAFGRTVAEALSLGRPVLGWAHGGVGELLARHFPEGAVPVGDAAHLVQSASRFLAAPQEVPPFAGTTLAQMQARTLDLYRRLSSQVPAP
jgi:glycosyltransferase involved in cell wall biosynthesis